MDFREISGSAGKYFANSNGEIRDKTGRTLKQRVKKSGFMVVSINTPTRAKYKDTHVHQLVCSAFHVLPEMYIIQHMDENRANNHLTNLRLIALRTNINLVQTLNDFLAVPGYNNQYFVNQIGEVANHFFILTPKIKQIGYPCVSLQKTKAARSSYITVHNVVYTTFKGEITGRVRHVDKNKLNNHVDNLVLKEVKDNSHLFVEDVSEFKRIASFGGVYMVNSSGVVVKQKNNKYKLVKKKVRPCGKYNIVGLKSDDNKSKVFVHDLVYETFVGDIPADHRVNHIDTDKLNDNVTNLELVLKVKHNQPEHAHDFKPIPGFDGKYFINTTGVVESKNKVIEQRQNGCGYFLVYLMKPSEKSSVGKQYFVHVLVFMTFRGPVPKNHVIDHIDRVKTNNNILNLRAVTHKENSQNRSESKTRRIIQKFTVNGVHVKDYDSWTDIKKDLVEIDKKQIEHLSNRILCASMQDCLHFRAQTAYGFVWNYKDELVVRAQKTEQDVFVNIGIIGDDDLSMYEVSNCGNVYSLHNNIILKTFTNNNYTMVPLHPKNLDGETKTYAVHRLVAFKFIQNDDPEHKIHVNHKDEDKQNNRAENLEWMTPKENVQYSTAIRVRQIDPKTGVVVARYGSLNDARRATGFTTQGISRTIKGLQPLYKNFKWELDD